MGNIDDEEQNDLGNETKSAEKKIDKIKKTLKKAAKFMIKHWKFTLIIVAIIIVILLLLVATSYVLKIIDGTEDSDDDSNVPASVSSYTSSTSVNDEGELTVDSTVQELWDELVEEDSRVSEYLDSAEELAKLINAELITQNVDTRSDPDEEIDWDEVIEEMTGESSEDEDSEEESEDTESIENTDEDTVTNIQGIIKFKRVTSDNTDGETMSYVDYDTFYGWIDEYESGETGVLDDLLTHFTLETTTTTSSSSSSSSSSSDETDTVSGETMKWPTDGTTITSEFGPREAPTEGASTDHKGIDISVSEGTNVYATEDGTVSYVDSVRFWRWRDLCYYRSWQWICI